MLFIYMFTLCIKFTKKLEWINWNMWNVLNFTHNFLHFRGVSTFSKQYDFEYKSNKNVITAHLTLFFVREISTLLKFLLSIAIGKKTLHRNRKIDFVKDNTHTHFFFSAL